MPELSEQSIPIKAEEDIVRVRRLVRESAQQLSFSLVDQTKIVTAASELARNTMLHGGGGQMLMQVVSNGVKTGLRLVFEDQGPGIPDLDLALRDGYTTGNGLGLGLGGAKRLVNEFQIQSKPGDGTRIAITRWK